MNTQDRLLSDEELRAAINASYLHAHPTEKMLQLINTQKRLYAESVMKDHSCPRPISKGNKTYGAGA